MRNRFAGLAVALLAATTVSACASSAAVSATQSAAATSGGRYVITEAELQAATERTLFELVQRQRPTFFRSRQVRSNTTPNPEPVHVFVDGTRVEGIESLRLFTPQNVKEVRFYEPSEANVRFGTGHHGGLISVTLLK